MNTGMPAPASAMRTSVDTMPPIPTASDFSITTTRRGVPDGLAQFLAGKGRNDVMLTQPIATPSSLS